MIGRKNTQTHLATVFLLSASWKIWLSVMKKILSMCRRTLFRSIVISPLDVVEWDYCFRRVGFEPTLSDPQSGALSWAIPRTIGLADRSNRIHPDVPCSAEAGERSKPLPLSYQPDRKEQVKSILHDSIFASNPD